MALKECMALLRYTNKLVKAGCLVHSCRQKVRGQDVLLGMCCVRANKVSTTTRALRGGIAFHDYFHFCQIHPRELRREPYLRSMTLVLAGSEWCAMNAHGPVFGKYQKNPFHVIKSVIMKKESHRL